MIGLLALTAVLLRQDPVEAKVEATLAQMTLEEKLTYIGGEHDFYIRAIPRLNLPQIKMSDGPVGVRTFGPTTAYPAMTCLAATWDAALGSTYGHAIGEDARARGVHVWLAPGVNMARIPQNGRNFEYFGEDPYLTSRFAVNVVKGVQSEGVVATVKHFAANDHENDRNQDSSEVDERTLHEIYLRPFEAAVREGGAWAIMCSYNKINGVYAAENRELLTNVLKKQWGFKGLVMSDWGAVHSVKPTALNGTDLEMPSGAFMNAKNLTPMVESGEVPVAVIDDKVRRILRVIYSMDFDKRPQLDQKFPIEDPKHDAVARQIAQEGIVLLKNRMSFLPLDRTKMRRILVVGPNAEPANTGGGGSSYATAQHPTSLVDAIKEIAGPGVEVIHPAGLSNLPTAAFAFDGYQTEGAKGLKAEYFANADLSGTPTLVKTEAGIDHRWRTARPDPALPSGPFSIRWTGSFVAPAGGRYVFVARSDDGMRVWLDGQKVEDMWHDQGETTELVPMELKAGKRYDLKVEYYDRGGEAIAQFGIVGLDAMIEKALPVEEAKSADAIVVAVGFNSSTEGEGQDRAFDLPMDQKLLIERATSLNDKTIVVNNSGGAVEMASWEGKTAAILQEWYPGQSGNISLAEILFGVKNPSGKLPMTFPRTLRGTYYETAYPPKDHKLTYAEGLLMGYRYFDAKDKEPLYPFGYGLSYTTFKLGGLELKSNRIATFWIENTGKSVGAEVVQMYVQSPDKSGATPVRQLKGFHRVLLRPGEREQVVFPITEDSLAYWDVAKHDWAVRHGAYTIYIGTSSRSLPLKGKIAR